MSVDVSVVCPADNFIWKTKATHNDLISFIDMDNGYII